MTFKPQKCLYTWEWKVYLEIQTSDFLILLIFFISIHYPIPKLFFSVTKVVMIMNHVIFFTGIIGTHWWRRCCTIFHPCRTFYSDVLRLTLKTNSTRRRFSKSLRDNGANNFHSASVPSLLGNLILLSQWAEAFGQPRKAYFPPQFSKP